MDKKKERNGLTSVPQFGGWDRNDQDATNYSVVFTKARANRRQNKTDIRRLSLGNEQDFEPLAAAHHHHHHHHHHNHNQQHQPHHQLHDDPVMKRKKILTYINCCIRPY